MLIAVMKCMHVPDKDQYRIEPQKSPVVYNLFHGLYLYFLAVKDGKLEPLLDYVIDGKYDEKFTEQVKPDFLTPDKKEELYLY